MAAPHDVPTAAQLVAAVRDFLADDVLPAVEGRVRFHTRVAINVLGMVEREIELGPAQAAKHERRLAGLGVADDADLAAAVRAGRFDDWLWSRRSGMPYGPSWRWPTPDISATASRS